MGRLTVALAALLLLAAAPLSVGAGVEKWRAGDYPGAIAIWQPFAAAGDADALFNLGQAYKLGRGVPRDLGQARSYYSQAAARGSLPAQANLGILLFQAGDKPEALRWLRTAADRGEPRAQFVLGVALYNGDGAPRSVALGYAYLLRARNAGLAQAATMLRSVEPMLSPAERTSGEAFATTIGSGPAAALPPATLPPTSAPSMLPPRAAPAPPPEPPVPSRQLPPSANAPRPTGTIDDPPTIERETVPAPRPPAPAVAEPPSANLATPKARPKPAGWRVQLGAFSTRALADAAWAAARASQRDALADASPLFDSSGPVVKLQVGPYPDRDAAKALCARLSAKGGACFVTRE